MKPPELSILIVSFNTRSLIGDCLRSLQRVADEVIFEVIVVDNASSDSSADLVAAQFPEVKLSRLEANTGFASAMNVGIDVIRAPLIMALNPDTLVPPGTLRSVVEFMNGRPEAGVAGAVLTYPDGSLQASTFQFPSLFREFWNFLPEIKSLLKPRLDWSNVTDVQRPRTPFQVDCVSGAALFARTGAVREIGGFDTDFFLYHEEMDLCARLRETGWEVWCVPEAQVIHFDAKSSGYRPNRLPGLPLLQWRIGGMDRLWAKHKSPRSHRLWRAQARGLLRLRILLLCLSVLFSQECKARIAELTRIVRMLQDKAESRKQKAEIAGRRLP